MANINMCFGKPMIVSKSLFRGRDRTWHLVKYKADVAIYAKCKCGWHFPCQTPKPIGDGINRLYSYCPACGARKLWVTNNVDNIDKFAWEDSKDGDNCE